MSGSEEDYADRGRVPTLCPGQHDGLTPWKEFLHRFQSCAVNWSEKTMAVQLRFWGCNTWWVQEVENAYGPSSELAAAVAIELRQWVRKVGESLHVLRDDIYDEVSVAYSDWTETEQDAIGIKVFTNAVGDAEIVQRLLEWRSHTSQ